MVSYLWCQLSSKGYGHHQVIPVQSLCKVLTLISVICPQLYKIRHLIIPS